MLTECIIFLFTSVCLYGIGMNRAIVLSQNMKGIFLGYFKSLLTTTSSVALSYLLIQGIIVPIGMQELYPIICILVFIFSASFFEVIIRLTTKIDVAELSVSFMSVVLAINESINLAESVLFVICCITSFYLLVPVLYGMRKRNESANSIYIFKNSLVLLGFAALILWLLVFDVSWLSGGLVK